MSNQPTETNVLKDSDNEQKKLPEKEKPEGENEEEKKTGAFAFFCQNNIAKILFIFLLILYVWSAEEVFIFTRTTHIAVLIERVKGGERERFITNLLNRLCNRSTLNITLLTGAPEEGEYELDPKIQRLVMYDKNGIADWIYFNAVLKNYSDISMIFYNGFKENEINFLVSQKKKDIMLLSHEFLYDHLSYGPNFEYFTTFNKTKLTIDFVPGEIPILKSAGIENALYLHKPIKYDYGKVKPAKLNTNNVLLFCTSIYPEKNYLTLEKGLTIFKKIVEKISSARLQILADFDYYTNVQLLVDLINKLALNNNVELVKNLTNIDEYYKGASLLLMPSPSETTSTFLLEAKMFGIPNIIAGKEYMPISGKEELKKEQFGSCWFKEDEIEPMALEAIKILDNERYRKEKGKEALNSMRYYSNEHFVRNWVNVMWSTSGGENMDEVHKQERKFELKPGFYERNEILMRNELEFLKQRNPALKCLQFEDLIDPLRGNATKTCN